MGSLVLKNSSSKKKIIKSKPLEFRGSALATYWHGISLQDVERFVKPSCSRATAVTKLRLRDSWLCLQCDLL